MYAESVFFGRKTFSSFLKASLTELEGGRYAGGSQPSCSFYLSKKIRDDVDVCVYIDSGPYLIYGSNRLEAEIS